MYFMDDISKLSNKEISKILCDFIQCDLCEKCKAYGVVCGFSNPLEVRMNFAKEVATRLMKEC